MAFAFGLDELVEAPRFLWLIWRLVLMRIPVNVTAHSGLS
jgi:hypothetical protein